MTPTDIMFTKEHEWIKDLGGQRYKIGITDHAQDALGDIVYVELPEVDDEIIEEDSLCTIESVKAVSDVYAPFDCRIVEANEALEDEPEMINQKPYDAWLVIVEGEINAPLLNAQQYSELISEDE